MQAYKMDLSMYEGKLREVVSTAVQQHAFELGYAWYGIGNVISDNNQPYLYFNDAGMMYGDTSSYFIFDKSRPISESEFLAIEKTEGANELYADFSWVKGKARRVLFDRCIKVCQEKGYTLLSAVRDTDAFFFIGKNTKHVFTNKSVSNRTKEIKCNDLLEGKF